jgi:hypothetical protein
MTNIILHILINFTYEYINLSILSLDSEMTLFLDFGRRLMQLEINDIINNSRIIMNHQGMS